VQLENVIKVPADPDRVWAYLLRTEEVVQCMPGATLTETVDDHTWKGRVNVSLGPLTLSYAGEVQMTERDDDAHRAVIRAEGTETRGNGNAQAGVTFTVEPGVDGGATLTALTELELDGTAAQYGQGMISAVSKQLSKQFARCVAAKLREQTATGPLPSEPSGAAPAPSYAATSGTARDTNKPIAGIRLVVSALLGALGRAVARFFRWVTRGFRSPKP
jgi:carbon monoxide dehydrogenase subunit G